ncbi:putative major facilitator superfamily transporter [Gordonia soli NBRC 108243]|uniref:Putative major facilitator superfamily transporter n=1 Tax=Gordonia soli NBRC 108243 TaxID=1223545 RepID=M0QDZ1_9ACTN|nr:putative major facilitator superfamily transporter [Gordonia soli NBRC 108243]
MSPATVAGTTLSRGAVARYAIGSLGTAGFSTLPGLVLVYYLTDTLGVAAILAGLTVAIAKVVDVLIDPAIGAFSDRDAHRHGTRRRLMLVGGLALPVFFVLTFAVPTGLPTAAAAGWVMVAFVLTAAAFSLFQVPYIALPAELTHRYDDRTRLLTTRVVVLTVGILAFGAGGPALRDLGSDSASGYLVMAVVTGLVIGAALVVSSASARDVVTVVGSATTDSGYRAGLAVLRRSRALRLLLTAFVLQGLATGMMLAGGQYIATWVLDSEGAVSFLFAALIAPALVFAPIWGRLARRYGKEVVFGWATAVFVLAALSLVALRWAPGGWVYVSVAVAGAAYAGMQALPLAMLPDVISDDDARHRRGAAGVVGGVWTAGETTGMACGAVGFTLLLTAGGYLSSADTADATQPGTAVTAMIAGFSVVPAVLAAISLIAIRRYPLRRSTIDDWSARRSTDVSVPAPEEDA